MPSYVSEFGSILMSDVRDRTIRLFDKKLQGAMKDEESKKLYERTLNLSDEQKKLLEDMIPKVVDLSIHNMLCMFEDHTEFEIVKDGENIVEMSDGLIGELYTSDGWISQYSEQR